MKPDVFAAVMATGIVSIAAADHGYHLISDVLVAMAAIALPVLMVKVASHWGSIDLRDPDTAVRLFTYVAACAVVGSRLAEHRIVLWMLAGMALQGWLSLMPVLIRAMWRQRSTLRDNARGTWELASVATSGLAIVCADLRLIFWAVVFWLLAIVVYCVMTPLILWRFRRDATALRESGSWILMGALAIATLAGYYVHSVGVGFAHPVSVVTWILATLWMPVLVCVGPRRIGWATVFPLGMYSSCTYAVAIETGWYTLTVVSQVAMWIALAAWLLVGVRVVRR